MRAPDIAFFFDAIQSLGALRLDVGKAAVDFLSADGHKWLLGPEGAGVFHCRKGLMEDLRLPSLGWASVTSPQDYLAYDTTPLPDARRFESGTLNTVGIYGLTAGLQLIERVGIDQIESRDCPIDWRKGLLTKRCSVFSSRQEGEKSGIVSFRLEDVPPENTIGKLDRENVVGALRGGYVRLSPHSL